MQSMNEQHYLECLSACSTPNRSLQVAQSICYPRILFQGLLASSMSRLEYSWNTSFAMDSMASFAQATASVAFSAAFSLGGFASSPMCLPKASVALSSFLAHSFFSFSAFL